MSKPRWVPSHLVHSWPAVMSLMIGLLAIAATPGSGITVNTTNRLEDVINVWAGLAFVMMFIGWGWNDRRWTYRGAVAALGVWSASLTIAGQSVLPLSVEWLFFMLIAASMLVLAAGVWLIIRDTPRAGEVVGWWLRRGWMRREV